jgi:sialate O-acetylesterase
MKHTPRHLILVCSIALAPSALAEVRLPKIISDHMVLQAEKQATLWGWADPQEKIEVTLGTKTATTAANSEGKWSVKLDVPAAGASLEMSVAGKNTVTVKDILIGEVWICSGQSNMEWMVSQSDNKDAESAAANYPLIRHFKVTRQTSDTPLEDLKGEWVVCSPATVPNFSAVGYFFGRELHKQLGDRPVGLIGTNWGGTPAESWASRKALEAEPLLKPLLERWDKQVADYNPENAQKAYLKAKEDWEKKAAEAKAANQPVPRAPGAPASPAQSAGRPANLYNAMIAPLLPLSVKGAIWYQGESNVSRAQQYRTLFPAMIRNWRADFNAPELPFYFVQIAPFRYNNPQACAELWEAQLHTLKTVPKTGMAVTTDIGNFTNIHPGNKQDVGLRLAKWALSKDYGKKGISYSGPVYQSAKVEGGKMRLSFEHAAGLKARDGKALTHFSIAGEDQKFVPAEATVDGEFILVHAADVTKPVAVRFAWDESAEPNFVNASGLPASPFRTDSFPAVTADKY